MAERLVQLRDKDDDKIYPVTMLQEDYILWDETEEDNQIVADVVGATSNADGKHGLVPQPNAGEQDKVLTGQGKWDLPLGCVLAFTEYTGNITLTASNGSFAAMPSSGYYQYGPLKGDDQNIKIVVPPGETWGVILEVEAHCWLGSYGTEAWEGPAIRYSQNGGSWVNWTSAIVTNRGTTSSDQYYICTTARYGNLSAGTWIFQPCYVNSNLTGNVYKFYGDVNADYSRGPSYVMKATLVDRTIS